MLVAMPLLATAQLYVPDTSWTPAFPVGGHTYSGVAVLRGRVYVTQRGNISLNPVYVLSTNGTLLSSFGSEAIGTKTTSGGTTTWGAHGIAVDGITGQAVRIYINDFDAFTLTAFDLHSPDFALHGSLRVGTPGVQGNGTTPIIQFGHLADTAIERPAAPGAPSRIYVSDGDGGSANRVIALEVSVGTTARGHLLRPQANFLWATPSAYHNPHSIAFHPRTRLLLLADREHHHLRLLRSADGVDLGSFDCGLGLGQGGKPFGVRTYADHAPSGLDVAFVAIMNNPQDGHNQKIAVLDLSRLSAADGSASPCEILQIIDVPTSDSGPHLLGVDPDTADVYAALVADAPRSWVLRYRLNRAAL